MPTADDLKHDVFVSYAQADDIPIQTSEGWVTSLVKHLQTLISQRLGRADAYSIWMDRRLSGNEPFAQAILENLQHSATLLIILSPAYLQSEWCRKERNYFLESISKSSNSDSRVFIVEVLPTRREEWPTELKNRVTFRFWNDYAGVPRTLGFPQPDRTLKDPYFEAVIYLCDGIVTTIKRLKESLVEDHEALLPTRSTVTDEAFKSSGLEPALSFELEQKRERGEYDVFLCHNSEDKLEVKGIGELLIAQQILPWLDEWDLRPGLPWQEALEAQIESIKSAAVFVGASGFGPWQNLELSALLREFAARRCPVIPVVLASCVNVPRLPTFLRGLHWVDFRVLKPNPLSSLTWGITGKQQRISPPE